MSGGHGHGHGVAVEVDRRWRHGLAAVSAAGLLVALVATIALWPREVDALRDRAERTLGLVREVPAATVRAVEDGTCPSAPIECRLVEVRILEGPDAGGEFVLEFPIDVNTPEFGAGDEIVLYRLSDEGPLNQRYQFADRQRRPVLWVLLGAFAVAVVLLGRGRGLGALAGLALSLAVVVGFLVPAVLSGRPPALVAIVAAVLVAYIALYLAHGLRGSTRAALVAGAVALGAVWMGWVLVAVLAALVGAGFVVRRLGPDRPARADASAALAMTHVALVGTVLALGVIVALAAIFTGWARFGGLVSDDTGLLRIASDDISLSALLLAGYVIAALGALDDVTVTQASAVFELRALDPTASPRRLFRAALRVGRDHVSSAVNTLALAYIGSSLPLVLLFALSRQSFGDVTNSEAVAVEIVGALVGSIGLVVAVPITTALAAVVAAPAVRPAP